MGLPRLRTKRLAQDTGLFDKAPGDPVLLLLGHQLGTLAFLIEGVEPSRLLPGLMPSLLVSLRASLEGVHFYLPPLDLLAAVGSDVPFSGV